MRLLWVTSLSCQSFGLWPFTVKTGSHMKVLGIGPTAWWRFLHSLVGPLLRLPIVIWSKKFYQCQTNIGFHIKMVVRVFYQTAPEKTHAPQPFSYYARLYPIIVCIFPPVTVCIVTGSSTVLLPDACSYVAWANFLPSAIPRTHTVVAIFVFLFILGHRNSASALLGPVVVLGLACHARCRRCLHNISVDVGR